jgi:cytochrome c5
MSDAHDHHDDHASPIRTPKQLIAAVAGFFLFTVIGIILLVKFVTTAKLTAEGSDAMSPQQIAARLRPVADEGFTLIDPRAPNQSRNAEAVSPASAPPAPASTAAAPAAVPPAPAAPAPSAAPATLAADAGQKLYQSACQVCHGAGIAGAPKFGDKAAWAPRIAQGPAVLNDHAIKGYIGKAGVMPPKGGSSASDDEVKAAVEYMVDAAK